MTPLRTSSVTRSIRLLLIAFAGLLTARATAANTIVVTTTVRGINADSECSLQEAIYAANFDTNTFVDPGNLNAGAITVGCAAGNGPDTIVLPDGAVFSFSNVASSIVADPFNYMGPTATPIIFTTITIEGNGARLERTNPNRDFSGTNFRAFAVGFASIVPNDGAAAVSGTGVLTIRNLYIRGFTAKGGDGASGGGGGMGAGGAIYVAGGTLTVESCTFENNGARGGDGSGPHVFGPGGGGGGIGGNGGTASGYSAVLISTGEVFGNPGEGGGGGGGGARGAGGANGGTSPFFTGWITLNGGGGGGTLRDGNPAFLLPGQGLVGEGGYRCGGTGGEFDSDGHDAPCLGGGGGGGGNPAAVTGFNSGDGGWGAYGGGGGGGGFHPSPDSTGTFEFGAHGGKGGFGGGGGAGSKGDNGGSSVFGGGGGAGQETPGAGGTFGGDGSHFYGGGGAALGGAIFNDSGEVTVRNSTFSGNYVLHGYAPAASPTFPGQAQNGADAGGAIFAVGGTLTVQNATLSANESTGESAAIHVYHPQTDVVVAPTYFNLYNTIVANSAPQVRTCQYHPDVHAAGAGNLIQANFGCPGMVSSADPLLGPLQLNAPGLTPTMAIGATSPAFNTADAGSSLSEDQRGVRRPQAIAFDIGAYEFIKPSADLAIAKTTVGQPYAGRYFSWVIDVENQGPTDAQSVSFTDTLPAGVQFTSITGSGGFSCTGSGPVTCTKSTMTAGEIDSFTLTVFIPANAAAGSTITNSVHVGSTTPDPGATNNTASVSAQIRTEADLTIAKSGPTAPIAGTNVAYSISAVNIGPSDAQSVLVSDTIASGTTFVSFTAPSGWSCVTPAVGAAGPAAITCSKATLSASAAAGFSLLVHLSPSAASGSQLCNTAALASSTVDPTPSNNASQTCGTVQTLADLALSQTVTTAGSGGKGTATFNLTLRNNGPSDSQNITLVANSSLFVGPPPAVEATQGGTCSVSGQNVICTWQTMAAGAADSVVISVPWRSAVGSVCDAASLTAGTTDPSTINNNSTECAAKKK